MVPCCIYCSTHGIILVGKDLWGSSDSSVSQLTWLTLGKLSTAFTEVLGESDWCLGWEEDGEMGRTVPSSSEQLDLLSCSGEWALQVAALLQKNGQVFFSLLPGKQRRAQRERGFRTLVCGASDRTVFFSIALKGLVLKSSFFYKEPDLFLRDENSPSKHIFYLVTVVSRAPSWGVDLFWGCWISLTHFKGSWVMQHPQEGEKMVSSSVTFPVLSLLTCCWGLAKSFKPTWHLWKDTRNPTLELPVWVHPPPACALYAGKYAQDNAGWLTGVKKNQTGFGFFSFHGTLKRPLGWRSMCFMAHAVKAHGDH